MKPARKSVHVLFDGNTVDSNLHSLVSQLDLISKITCSHTQQFIKGSHFKTVNYITKLSLG